jgi:pyruvate,water dikinase
VLPLSEVGIDDVAQVGGKSASLGEMIRALAGRGVRVPGGFAVTVEAFRGHLEANGLVEPVRERLAGLDPSDVTALAAVGRELRERVEGGALPPEVAAAAREAYAALAADCGVPEPAVAVRSSATAEDLPGASFAGQQETLLEVRGWDALELALRRCMASLYTDRAIAYRAGRGIDESGVGLSVCVQRMVPSAGASSGVLFTLDTESGFRGVVLVTASWGLGEAIVQGRVNPDEYLVHKATLAAGHRPLLRRELGEKAVRTVVDAAGGVVEEEVPAELRGRFVLEEEEVLELARIGLAIEEHYGRPMDVEWARDGGTGELFVVQARPETVHARSDPRALERFRLTGSGEVLVRGRSVGARIASGPVRVLRGAADLPTVREGEVLVSRTTDPDWEPVLRRAAAIVTDQGGRTCHAAILSRELGVPCVVGTGDATLRLATGDTVTVSCAGGDEGRVLAGRVPFEREVLDLERVPASPVPLHLNLADPDLAFGLASLPAAGVGLLRTEFLVSRWIGAHPMACAHPDRVRDAAEREELERRAAPFGGPEAFFVERMASGVGQIAAAFHPRPVLVRLSDFKTNEYAGLLGGAAFEPVEANPMIGFRGAARYADERYRDGFALECRALRRVRERFGLENVRIMVPFCRTLGEARAVLDELARHGLERGRDGLEVWVMCEIPNNVLLATEFAGLFDGFSIGSNDLTQLVLGVDRDSELLAGVFDERDPGVLRAIELVLERAHAAGRPVGICGQAPSDHPDLARWLFERGIDSMSLNPDSLVPVATRLAGSPAAS